MDVLCKRRQCEEGEENYKEKDILEHVTCFNPRPKISPGVDHFQYLVYTLDEVWE